MCAAAMAAEFSSLDIRPDQVLCSAAARARETLDAVRSAFPTGTSVAIEERLYMASAENLMRRLRAVPDAAASVMVIGHNPGLQELALLLSSDGSDADTKRRLIADLPPAALAILTGKIAGWDALSRGTLRLDRLIRPKDLQQR